MAGPSETITIREARPQDADGIARVSVDTWRATYRGIMPDGVLDGLSYERRAASMRETIQGLPADQPFLVAETNAGEIVAFAGGGRERTKEHGYDGEIYAVYVLPKYQGRGLGKRLMHETARRLVEVGNRSIMLWVATENHPSRAFYERLGGQYVAERDLDLAGTIVAETGYGWPDARDLTR